MDLALRNIKIAPRRLRFYLYLPRVFPYDFTWGGCGRGATCGNMLPQT
jgi:hypothetical protein